MYGQAQAFPARLFLSSLRGRWLPNWVAPLGSGIEPLSNEVVLYRRSNKFALGPDKIGLLALEAEFRGMSIGAFISELITSTAKNAIFQQVLDTEITSGTPAGQPTT